MRALVIVPTYQEALNLPELLPRIRATLPSADVIVVDDSSPDGTADIARELGEELGQIDVLVRPQKEGLARAYRQAWGWAMDHGYDAVIDMDADGSHDPAALPALLRALEEGADMAMGSRYIPGGAVPGWPLRRLLLSKWGNRYASLVLDLPVHDATGGYRAYRLDLLRAIDLSTLQADGYGFQIELAYRATRLGAKVVEIPITFVDRHLGKSKMSGSIVREALLLVTWWGVRDRVLRRGRRG